MTPLRGHVRLAEVIGSFLSITFDCKDWSEVQDSKLSHRHSAQLACNVIHFGHLVILTIVGTGWDDAPPPSRPRSFKDGQKPVRAALAFFSNLWAITAQLLVKGWPEQVRQRSNDSTSLRKAWLPPQL